MGLRVRGRAGVNGLLHEPAGTHHPYEPARWGRDPLWPLAGEPVRVGARADVTAGPVRVEWEAEHSSGAVPALFDGETWQAELGPFKAGHEVRYRFVGVEGSATPWFVFSTGWWESPSWRGLAVHEGAFEVSFGSGAIVVTPLSSEEAAWHVRLAASGDVRHDRAALGDWEVRLEAGRLRLSRGSWSRLFHPPRLRTRAGRCEAVELAWGLDANEHILGTGERYDALDQRGRTPDIRVYDQYKGQGAKTYIPVPFFVSSSGYGWFVDSADRIRFDFGRSYRDVLRFEAPIRDGGLSGRLFLGPPKTVLFHYTALTGRPSPLPDRAFGPWMSGNEWNSEARIRDVVERTIAEDIPATVIVIEAWSDETTFYLFGDAEHDQVPGSDPVPLSSQRFGARWPDPVGLVRWLHEQGLRVLLWQIPVLKDEPGHPQHDRDLAHAEAQGYCVRTEQGVYRNRAWWFPGARVLDFTNPDARRWWFAKRTYLVSEVGIDGFKTDGGEHLWGADVVTFAGERGDEAANRYPVHYEAAYHEFLRASGHERPLTFSRSGFAGAQRFPAHWAGDEDSTWDAFRASIVAGLSAGASGIAFWGWDLAGFSGPLPSAELYCRAAAAAAFCPIMQYHSEFNEHRDPPIDRTPWNVAEQTGEPRVLDVYRHFARLRMRLLPYLAAIGKEASEKGVPLMRALALEFPDDPICWEIADEFCLGPALLVAPVLEEGATERRVYLPHAEWRDFWSGRSVEAGWHRVAAPLSRIPVFVREGSWMTPAPPDLPSSLVEHGRAAEPDA